MAARVLHVLPLSLPPVPSRSKLADQIKAYNQKVTLLKLIITLTVLIHFLVKLHA